MNEKVKEKKLVTLLRKIRDNITKIEKMYVVSISEEENNDILEIVEYYRKHINVEGRLTKGVKERINSRLREFSSKELKDAIDKFAANSWRMENNSDKGMVWFFKNEEQIAKWLQLKPEAHNKVIKIGS